ncbi:MAG TPA: T9SS type A sorting domain-containing protein [Candidatus Cloacimonetes bacterium]|nr:T9SS type A sorting domain-containing protein [Candidatus Cloacimonadota bacterium]
MKKIILLTVFLISVSLLLGGPYTTPTIDGDLSDWDLDELRVDDPTTDSAWGSGNEFDNLWVTWDAVNLYVGIEYTASDNAMIVYFDMGITGGETDFNSGNGYAGAYPRNITFDSADDIDLMIASWNSGSPWVWNIVDNASNEIGGSCVIAGTTTAELAIPWLSIYGDLTPCIVPTGAVIKAVGVIAGGDNWGACDSAPDNSDTNGDGGPDHLTNLWTTNLDSNPEDCIPDFEPPTPVILSSFTAEYVNSSLNLNWTTQSESDNAGWNIYRSDNEILDYAEQINNVMIEGAGTTSEPTEYTFVDENPVVVENTYWYWIESLDGAGTTQNYGPISITIPSINEDDPTPPDSENPFALQNYPNPFSQSTEISFIPKEEGYTEISIYNTKGQKIITLFSNNITEVDKRISVTWNGLDESGNRVLSGIYFSVLKIGNSIYTKKLVITK